MLQLESVERILVSILAAHKSFSVDVFGSRANGKFKPYSDLDLWIEADPKVSDKEIAELFSLFEESDLPFKVDLVTEEKCLEAYRTRIKSEKLNWLTKS